MEDTLQIQISLRDSKPKIFRTVLVRKDITFWELHCIIQVSMGWDNSHLFEFDFKEERIGIIFEDEEMNWGRTPKLSAGEVRLEEKLTGEKEKFGYLYDFGDSWEHEIKVMKSLPADPALKYPHCIKGAMNCPPEDSGGLGGFYYSLEVLQDKKHPEYEDLKEWYGRYNPEKFNKEKINVELRKLGKFLRDKNKGRTEL